MQPVTFWGIRLTSAALLFLTTSLASTQLGCFASTAKLRIGPTVDANGTAAVQADLAFGFGAATSNHSGVTASAGVGTGSRNHFELTNTIEYHHLDDDYGWRTGIRADFGLVGDAAIGGWILGAFLLPIEERRRRTNTSSWSLGIEGRFGYLSHEVEEDGSGVAVAVGAAATLEWHFFGDAR